MARILLVDDDVPFSMMLSTWLSKRGFTVVEASSHADAVKLLKEQNFEAVLTDLRLPDKDGIELLRHVKGSLPNLPVLLMTGYADIQTAVLSIKLGAFDYVSKPVIPEDILAKVHDALRKNKPPTEPSTPHPAKVPYIIGQSGEAAKLYEYVRLVAPTQMSVLITGESGSGKEYIARLIHSLSARSNAPFVAVDCGAIPKDLAAGEFFGHIKGAFTGAMDNKIGFFESASGGTIFLDEIGNLGYDVQVQLLRAIEERMVRPLGSRREVPVDVRIISATNENLVLAVEQGTFREDLFHRLNEFSVKALRLCDRPEDIPLFVNHFLDKANAELNKQITGFDKHVMDAFMAYNWPGNLRELRNVVRRATLLCQTSMISLADVPTELTTFPTTDHETLAEKKEKNEIELIKEALQQARYNKSEAARLLNIDRKTLYNKLKIYHIH
ncbi:MAG: sigma-54 dependent transcriptional regulator [Breznakibacter sp.]